MKLFKNISYLFVSLLIFTSLSSSAAEKILFISDIDDTIKISHIRSKSDSASTAFSNFSTFTGMSDLYNLLNQSSDFSIYYVSNAPQFLMHSSHSKFLNQFQFPQSEHLKTRENLSDDQFKVKTILGLVKSESPDILILVGDNGEQDPNTFHTIRSSLKNSKIKILTFVHWLYPELNLLRPSKYLDDNDVAYVTPSEIILHLEEAAIISPSKASDFLSQNISDVFNETREPKKNTKTFPAWFDCRGYQWKHPESQSQSALAQQLKSLLAQKCSSTTDPYSMEELALSQLN